MARDSKGKPPQGGNSGKGKITVVMFQLEGSDETLQDAIRVLGQGLEKLAPGAPVYQRVLPPSRANGNAALPPGGETDATIEPEYTEIDEPSEEDGAETTAHVPKPRKRRIQKALAPLKGVDWESGKIFDEYANEKRPANHSEKYLVVAGWFKNFRNEETITTAHIVAAFDKVDWPKPENIGQVFRNLKYKNEWFDNGEKNGQWCLAQRGINHLDRLGRSDVSAEE